MNEPKRASQALSELLATQRIAVRCLRWVRFGLLAVALVASTQAQTPRANAGQVQAAYLYNFGKFVKWPALAPANQSGAFIICVLEEDPFGDTLQSTLSGETIASKPVVVKRLHKPQEASACHILFISASQSRDLKGILSSLDESAVLTVSDMPDFSKRGGMIQFVFQGDRIRFEVNLDGAERSHLVFPSELLKVASAVRRSAGTGE
jgi:hypothetical protein